MMREILLPSLGEGITTGTVVGILVKEGDMIQKEQGLIEVETDKVTTEVPSDFEGYVAKILVEDGQEINQGEVILLLEDQLADHKESQQVDSQTIVMAESTTDKSSEPIAPATLEIKEIDINLPSLGEGVDSGAVVTVLVSIGDIITTEQELIEVETDKVTMAVPSDQAGEVVEIYVVEGDDVSVGTKILRIKASIKPGEISDHEDTFNDQRTESIESGSSPELEYAASIKPPNLRELNAHNKVGSSSSSRTTPRARKLARQLSVDLQNVNSDNGLITTDLIKSFVRSRPNNTESSNSVSSVNHTALPSFDKWGGSRSEPMSGMIKATAKNMSESWRTIPHAWLQEKADITSLEKERKNLNQQNDLKLSTTVYIIKALTIALHEYPMFNASIDMLNNQIVYKDYYNIGVAVDSEHGLYVPVIKNTDRLGLKEIGDQLKNLAQLAKGKKLTAGDLDGGNITISNLGVIGTTAIFPIILSPQVSILGIAGYEVKDGHKILPMTIAFDHRIINGADAARFLSRIKYLLEHPYSLIFN